MAEFDAKVNMSLDEIIKLGKKENKKKSSTINGKKGELKKNIKRVGGGQKPSGRGGAVKRRDGNLRKNSKALSNNAAKVRSQAWRLQRRQSNAGFVGKRYKQQQNGTPKRSQSGLNLNRNGKQQQQKSKQQLQGNKMNSFTARRAQNVKSGSLTRSRSRSNIAAIATKNFITNSRGLKKTNSLPNLRDPNSVHNRLGYQSPAQVAYRNRVKRAKQLLLHRQSQKLLSADRMTRRPAKTLTALHQRALERRQQIFTSPRPFNTGGLRSDQILRSQRRAQYTQKLIRMNAARINPNVNFMCTLGEDFSLSHRQRPLNMTHNQNRNNSLRHLSRDRSPFRSAVQGHNTMSRAPLFPRSRSRSRSRSRPTNLLQANTNVDDRSFSEVMYSVSNNLGVTGRTLNDRFSF